MRDYINIGSTGLAQAGQIDKQRKEGKYILEYVNKNYPVPEGYSSFAHYSFKSFPHDFGRYSELVIVFDVDAVEAEPDKHKFWDWVNEIESIDFEEGSDLYAYVEAGMESDGS